MLACLVWSHLIIEKQLDNFNSWLIILLDATIEDESNSRITPDVEQKVPAWALHAGGRGRARGNIVCRGRERAVREISGCGLPHEISYLVKDKFICTTGVKTTTMLIYAKTPKPNFYFDLKEMSSSLHHIFINALELEEVSSCSRKETPTSQTTSCQTTWWFKHQGERMWPTTSWIK